MRSTSEERTSASASEELRIGNTGLRQSRDFAMAAFDAIRIPLLVLDRESRLVRVNQAFCRMFQLSEQESEGRALYSLSQGDWDRPDLRALVRGLIQGGIPFTDSEIEIEFRDVGRKVLLFGGCRIDRPNLFLISIDDVTEHRNQEALLRQQSERAHAFAITEATGRLASAVAHELNNLIASIIGYSRLLLDTLGSNEAAIQQMMAIRTAGDRATSFTQQLMAFGRCQTLQPELLDLNGMVSGLEEILRSLAGERITVVIDNEPGLLHVRADPDQAARAILSLFLNAENAIGDAAGTVTIQTANVILNAQEARQQELVAGSYVRLAVRDTAGGMDAERQANIFEPFLTTKGIGNGSGRGLGLAAVRGFVEQSGGVVRCASQSGQGTTISLVLPAIVGFSDKSATR